MFKKYFLVIIYYDMVNDAAESSINSIKMAKLPKIKMRYDTSSLRKLGLLGQCSFATRQRPYWISIPFSRGSMYNFD